MTQWQGYLERRDGALRQVPLADPWEAPALGRIDLPVHDPIRCRAGIVAWLAYPRIDGSEENQRKKVTAALAADAWLAAIKEGRLTVAPDNRPAKRKDLPDYARPPALRKCAREAWAEKGLHRADERLRDAEAFCFPLFLEGLRDTPRWDTGGCGIEIEDAPEDAPQQLVIQQTRDAQTGEILRSQMLFRLPARSISGIARRIDDLGNPSGEANPDNVRARRWQHVRHVMHLARAVNLAGEIPTDPAGLRRLLEEAEACRLLELPALGVAPEGSLQFRVQV